MTTHPAASTIGAILVVWVVLGIVAMIGLTLPTPPVWFAEWSKLIATVVVAAVGARVLWEVPHQLRDWLDLQKRGS